MITNMNDFNKGIASLLNRNKTTTTKVDKDKQETQKKYDDAIKKISSSWSGSSGPNITSEDIQNLNTAKKEYDIASNAYDTSNIEKQYKEGNLDQDSVDKINSRFGVILDGSGKETSVEDYQKSIENYNKNVKDINSKIETLNNQYKNGLINEDIYKVSYANLENQFNDNAKVGENLSSYTTKTGFDYYDWAKENGKDVTDFEKYVESFDDSFIENLGNLYAASIIDTASIIPETLGILKTVSERNKEDGYNFADENTFSSKFKQTSDELKEYAFNGTNGFHNWSLQTISSLMPMINAVILGGVGGLTGSALNTFTNVTLGLQNAGETTRLRMNEGNDVMTSVTNGAIHGAISGLVESLDAGKVVNLITGDTSALLLGPALLDRVNIANIAKYLNNVGMQEGAEEIIEAIADNLADTAQNKIASIFGNEQVDVSQLNPTEMAQSFVMAYAGALLLGAKPTIDVTINSNATYNAAQETKRFFESTLASPVASEQVKDVARVAIADINNNMSQFQDKSVTRGAVEFVDEQAQSLGTYDEVLNNLTNAMRGEVQEQLALSQKTLEESNKLRNTFQKALYDHGYDVNADVYMNLNEKAQKESKVALDFGNKTGNKVEIVDNLPEGENGFFRKENGTIVIDGTKAPILSTLAHELTHGTESSKFYGALDSLVSTNYDGDIDTEIERIKNVYNSFGKQQFSDFKELTTEDARKEFVAKQVEKLLGNEKFINDLVKYKTSIASKIYQDLTSMGTNDEVAKIKNAFEKAFADAKLEVADNGIVYSVEDYDNIIDDIAKNPKKYTDDTDGKMNIGVKVLDNQPKFFEKGAVKEFGYRKTVIRPSALSAFFTATGPHTVHIGEASINFLHRFRYLIQDPIAVIKSSNSNGVVRYGAILNAKATAKAKYAPMYAVIEPYQGGTITKYNETVKGELQTKVNNVNTVVAMYPLDKLVNEKGIITKDRLKDFFSTRESGILYSSLLGREVRTKEDYRIVRDAIMNITNNANSNTTATNQFSIDTDNDTYTLDWGRKVPNPLNVNRSKYSNWKVTLDEITKNDFLNYDINGKTIKELIDVGEKAREWLLAPEIEKLRVAEDYDLDHLSEDGMNYIKKMDEIAKAIPFTINDNSDERKAYRLDQIEKYKKDFFIDKDIPKERKAWIELGVSGGGKSSFIKNNLNANGGLIDSDELKFMSNEFKKYGGLYSNALHAESDMLSKMIGEWATDEGYNVIYPLVGRNKENIIKLIDNLKSKGYTEIHLGAITIPLNKSMYRIANRFIEDDRYLPNFYALRADNETRNPIKTYNDLKNTEGVIDDGLWNTDVPKGSEYTRVNTDSKDGYGNGSLQQEEGRINSTGDNGRDRNIRNDNAGELSNKVNESSDSFLNGTQQFSENLLKSAIINDEQKETVRKEVANDGFSYSKIFNKQEYDAGVERFNNKGLEKSFTEFMNNDKPSYKTVIDGEILVKELAQNNDARWEEVSQKLADDATDTAQALQAYAILQRMTPQGQLRAIERSVYRMQQELDENMGNKAPKLEISQELRNNLLNAKTQEEMDSAREEIAKDLDKQRPKTIGSMLNSWRYLAMLGNPRTHIRNILGNALFRPMIALKNVIGTGLEKAFVKNGIKTKAILTNSEVDKARYAEGKRMYKEMRIALEKGNKYEHQSFSEKTVIGKVANKISNKNSQLLDAEDFWFSSRTFADSYAQFMKANDLTADTMSAEMQKRAVAYASDEALKSTYRDADETAKWLNKLETNKKTKVAGFFKKALLPFTQTPINIIKRGVTYSPIGLIETTYKYGKQIKNGNLNTTQFLDSLASNLSGTSIAVLGAFLAKMGIFRTKDDDKDRKKYFDQENGEQEYSIDLSPLGINGTYTIDWTTPTIMPFAMGAELYNGLKDFEGIQSFKSAINAVADISSKIFDPIMETSMLSSVQDGLKSWAEGGEWLGDMIMSMTSSYVQQMFPTLGGQIARTIDDTRRTTYPNDGGLDKLVKQVLNKIPFASKLNEPYINKQGEVEKNETMGAKTEVGKFLARAFLNFVSPGYYSSKDIDEYDEELYRLYDQTKDINVLPSSTSKSITYEDVDYEFTDKEYTEWHKQRYTTEAKYVNEFIDSSVYKDLSDEERVNVITNVRKYAQMVAKDDFLKSKGIEYDDVTYNKVKGALEKGVDLYNYYLTGDYYKSLSTADGDVPKTDYIDYLNKSDMNDDAKQYMYGLEYGDSKVYGYIEDMGYDSKTKLSMYEILADTIADKDENGKTISNSKAQKIKEQYIKLGVYDDIIDYISSHKDVNYSSFGLSKTVVEGNTSTDTLTNAYSKVLGSNKAALETNSSKTTNATSRKESGSSVSKNASYNKEDTLAKAYSKTMSSSGNKVTCSKCGKTVTPINGKCPVCGAKL